MKKYVVAMLSLTLIIPCIASASIQDHYYFRSSQPDYRFEATYNAPFNVGCGLGGTTKDQSATFTLIDTVAATNYGLQHADVSQYGYSATQVAPRTVSQFIYGTDVEQTDVSGGSVTISYKDPGEKGLWFGETDGTQTEVRFCGAVFIAPVHIPVVKTLSNGVSLTF